MTTLATETWTGTTGAAWPSQWTTFVANGAAAATIQSNTGQLTYPTVGNYVPGSTAFLSGMAATVSVDVLFDVTFTNAGVEQYLNLCVGVTTTPTATSGPTNCYALGFYPANGSASMGVTYNDTNGNAQNISGDLAAGTWASNTTKRVRYQRINSGGVNTLRVRVWDPAATEPTTWLWSGTDTRFPTSSGKVAFLTGPGYNVTTGNVRLDNLTVTDGATTGTTDPGTGGTGTGTYTETFTGTTGAAWSSAWVSSTDNGSATIQANAGRITSQSSGPYSSHVQWWTGAASGATDGEFTGSAVFPDNTEKYLEVGLSGATGTATGYVLNIQPANAAVEIGLVTAGNNYSPQASASYTYPAAGTTINWRFKRAGATLYGRIWSGSTEPTTWNVQWTDTSGGLTSGVPFLMMSNGSAGTAQYATVDSLTYTAAGSSGTPTAPTMPSQVSGAYLKSTTAGTQVFKYEVTTSSDTSLSTTQRQAFVYVPGNRTASTGTKFVMAAHGLGDNPSLFMEQASITDPLLQLLMDNGYVVIVPAYDATLGNADGQARLARAYAWGTAKWTNLGTVLFGFSMGGATSAVAMHKGTIPQVKAVQVVAGVVNFADAASSQQAAMYAAYGATDAASFTANTADWDPMRQPVSKYAGQRWRINSSTDDGYTFMRPDDVAFLNYIAPVATQAIDVQVYGGHGSSGQFVNPELMLAFYENAMASVAGPTPAAIVTQAKAGSVGANRGVTVAGVKATTVTAALAGSVTVAAGAKAVSLTAMPARVTVLARAGVVDVVRGVGAPLTMPGLSTLVIDTGSGVALLSTNGVGYAALTT